MFPLRDDNPTQLTPVVTIGVLLANVAVWLYVQGAGMSQSVLADSVCTWGMIPAEITGTTGAYEAVQLAPGAPPCVFGGLRHGGALTSMFLHGSWLHLLANMWFLWLFGNNVEDSMGHLRYALFYVLTGAGAAVGHIVAGPDSMIPTVGASGAISGLMGAYLVLYPRVKIQTLFIFVFIFRVIAVPAWLVLVLWFALQLLAGATDPLAEAGVAFWAHIGGFVAGVVLVKLFENRQLVAARSRHVQLAADEIRYRGWL